MFVFLCQLRHELELPVRLTFYIISHSLLQMSLPCLQTSSQYVLDKPYTVMNTIYSLIYSV